MEKQQKSSRSERKSGRDEAIYFLIYSLYLEKMKHWNSADAMPSGYSYPMAYCALTTASWVLSWKTPTLSCRSSVSS